MVQPTGTAADELVDHGSVESDDILRRVSTLTNFYYANEVAGMVGHKIFFGLNMG